MTTPLYTAEGHALNAFPHIHVFCLKKSKKFDKILF